MRCGWKTVWLQRRPGPLSGGSTQELPRGLEPPGGGARVWTLLLQTPRAPNHRRAAMREARPASGRNARQVGDNRDARPGDPHSGQPRPPPPTPARAREPRALADRRSCDVAVESPRERDWHRGDPHTPPPPATHLCPPPRDRPLPPQPPPPRAHAAAAATVAAACAVPLGGLRRPIPTPPQPPPVYNDWDGTGRAGPARKRTPSSRRSRLPGPSSQGWRPRPTRANVRRPRAVHAGRCSSRQPSFAPTEGISWRKYTTTPKKHRAPYGFGARRGA